MPIEGLIDAHGEGRRRVTLHARHPGPLRQCRLHGGEKPRGHRDRPLPDRRSDAFAACANRRRKACRIARGDAKALGYPDHRNRQRPRRRPSRARTLEGFRTAAPRRPCRGARPRAPLPSRRNDRRAPSARRQDGPRRRRLAAGIFFAGDARLARKPLPDWPRRPAAMRGRSRIFSRAAGHSRCALRSAPRSTRSRPTAARSRRSTRRRGRRPACGR